MKNAVLLRFDSLKHARDQLRILTKKNSGVHAKYAPGFLGAEQHDPKQHDLKLEDGCGAVMIVFIGLNAIVLASQYASILNNDLDDGRKSLWHPIRYAENRGITVNRIELHDCQRHNPPLKPGTYFYAADGSNNLRYFKSVKEVREDYQSRHDGRLPLDDDIEIKIHIVYPPGQGPTYFKPLTEYAVVKRIGLQTFVWSQKDEKFVTPDQPFSRYFKLSSARADRARFERDHRLKFGDMVETEFAVVKLAQEVIKE